jgi:Domain of unknown function (DUF4123)/Inner membrane component of T3SS, cytoplasmic domain
VTFALAFAEPMPPARRSIVEVRGGPIAYPKAILQPGHTMRVGRSNLADLAVHHDAQMSAEHLTLTWDGERCVVRDLDSASGTWIHGTRIADGELTNGAWIRAGATNLMVYFEAHTRPRDDDALASLATEKATALHALERCPDLFAVVDASCGPRPLRLLRESVDEHRSLYDGTKGEALAHCAPYLVALRRDSGLLERLMREGWGERWAIFFTCARPFKDVRRHLRRFLVVEDDDTGEKYYFRFYDPRTLRAFLPSCTPRQHQDFLGEFSCFLAEGERGELLRFPREPSSP